ncbi:hypothetical protein D0B32_09545 [Paraburkholderia sp. DHOC27]|nr:hypothetical protein D0B32_09545 [Paraburkholderia sp. DHOC27]
MFAWQCVRSREDKLLLDAYRKKRRLNHTAQALSRAPRKVSEPGHRDRGARRDGLCENGAIIDANRR